VEENILEISHLIGDLKIWRIRELLQNCSGRFNNRMSMSSFLEGP
jgi:hypothetical protein